MFSLKYKSIHFLADHTNGRAIGIQCWVRHRLSSVVCTERIVAKRRVLEQKLLLTAYRKSYMRNRLVPTWIIYWPLFRGRMKVMSTIA